MIMHKLFEIACHDMSMNGWYSVMLIYRCIINFMIYLFCVKYDLIPNILFAKS